MILMLRICMRVCFEFSIKMNFRRFRRLSVTLGGISAILLQFHPVPRTDMARSAHLLSRFFRWPCRRGQSGRAHFSHRLAASTRSYSIRKFDSRKSQFFRKNRQILLTIVQKFPQGFHWEIYLWADPFAYLFRRGIHRGSMHSPVATGSGRRALRPPTETGESATMILLGSFMESRRRIWVLCWIRRWMSRPPAWVVRWRTIFPVSRKRGRGYRWRLTGIARSSARFHSTVPPTFPLENGRQVRQAIWFIICSYELARDQTKT